MIISFLILLILHLLTPFWWWILIVPFFYGLIRSRTGGRAFAAGMFSAGLLWFLAALHSLLADAGLIAQRITQMMNGSSPYLLLGATTLIGISCGGFAASTGFLLKAALVKKSDTQTAEEKTSPEERHPRKKPKNKKQADTR